ncbi:MAG: ribosome recycling factor [Sphingobacteriales bacterium]|jgi:ribosome recycling factor|nr:ribosome recycling factor [Sphingobacteriales bacterium]MBP9140379.1 ribosome recycling factor [Chitinophagales bacterium]MDA0197355.1 ribosome recycling factor [Bacteroidota bacterium]MBK6890067.1 ribosome recycling factor [Sphingobacteriales bacterium]MBK7527407.1 ribosome recycling factor [Sphingobacteriales bacterium]
MIPLEEANKVYSHSKDMMHHSIEHLEKELTKVRAGKASPAMVDGIYVDYYGTNSPISQVANITTGDARTLLIQPWERNMLGPIEKAIFAANLGMTPQNDGNTIRLNLPPLTEERRKDLVKQVKHIGEQTKVGIRNVRKEAMEKIKKMVKDGLPEDNGKTTETQIQKATDEHIEKVDKILLAKEKEIMAI